MYTVVALCVLCLMLSFSIAALRKYVEHMVIDSLAYQERKDLETIGLANKK